ncbi:MAG: hypothetical protein D6809_03730 [Gammaproteobacteria bacterium]|nr:MAG: hypothetical protein D6809_03730 [Gammaproteobacteria bacterium]
MPVGSITGGPEGNALTGVRQLRFVRPVAVSVRDQWVYVLDAGQDLVLRYDRLTGRLARVLELRGALAGSEPVDLYVARDRSLYVADTQGSRVLHFDARGRLLRTYTDTFNLARPVALAVDPATRDLYVADGVYDHILVFNVAGKLRRALGSRGTGEGQFLNLTGLALDGDEVYATARLGLRGQVLGRDGRFLRAFGRHVLVFPRAVAVGEGRIFVADWYDNSIKIFSRDGRPLATYGGTGVAPGRFKGLTDVWYEAGFLYAADSLNGRIQVFRLPPR